MSTLHVSLPDDLLARLSDRAVAAGYGSVERYAEAVLREEAWAADLGAPDHLTVCSREQLDALLEDGLASPSREMSESDWDDLRRRLQDARAPGQGR